MKAWLKQLLFSCALALAGNVSLRAENPKVELKEEGPLYLVEGRFSVETDLTHVWSVLTDYGRLKGIVSSLTKSEILQREGSTALVEQVAVGRFLFFSRAIALKLRIVESPYVSIRFEQVEGTGAVFPHYRGSWTLEEKDKLVHVTYRLDISRNAVAPSFLERGLFKAQSGELMKELRDEILCRGKAEAEAKLKALDPTRLASSNVGSQLP